MRWVHFPSDRRRTPSAPRYQEGADADRRKALADVGLSEIDVKDHHAETQDWIKTLSMGQQQRLVLAQILLRSTPPKALCAPQRERTRVRSDRMGQFCILLKCVMMITGSC